MTTKISRPEGSGEPREETRVRSREVEDAASRNTVPPPRASRGRGSGEHRAAEQAKSSGRDSSDSIVVRRGEQLEKKARLARQLLERLPPNDRRRRLLHAAILRRDEILLDGFISELSAI
jgi:hypothetical protein